MLSFSIFVEETIQGLFFQISSIISDELTLLLLALSFSLHFLNVVRKDMLHFALFEEVQLAVLIGEKKHFCRGGIKIILSRNPKIIVLFTSE